MIYWSFISVGHCVWLLIFRLGTGTVKVKTVADLWPTKCQTSLFIAIWPNLSVNRNVVVCESQESMQRSEDESIRANGFA